MHGAAARRVGYMDVPHDIFAGGEDARTGAGPAARRVGYRMYPMTSSQEAKMHGRAQARPPEGWGTGCTP